MACNPTPWLPPKIWQGERVFIIGGGPSLANQDLTTVHNEPVIGINNAYKLGDWVDVLFFMDRNFFEGHGEREGHRKTIREFGYSGWLVTTCRPLAKYPGVRWLKVRKYEGIDTEPGCLVCSRHAGSGAVNLAVNLGARRIVLLGFDMCVGSNGSHNWHNEHFTTAPARAYKERFEPVLKSMRAPIKELGVEVVNATPGSALMVWPMTSLEEELRIGL